MTRLFAHNLLKFSLQFLQERLGVLFLTGWICGIFLFSCIQRFQTFASDSPEVIIGLGLAVTIGVWLGLPSSATLSKRALESATTLKSDQSKIKSFFIILSLWSICFPVLLSQLNQILHLVSVQQVSNFVFLTGLMTLSAMVLILPVVFWSSRLFWLLTKHTGFNLETDLRLNRLIARYLMGIGVALFTAAYWIVPQFGWYVTLAFPVGFVFLICCGPWIVYYSKPYLPEAPQWLKFNSAKEETEPAPEVSHHELRNIATPVPFVIRSSRFVISLAAGILFVTLSRILFQLFPDSLYLKVTLWAAFFAGIAAAFLFIRSRGTKQQIQTATGLTLGLSIMGISFLALFPLLVSCMLYANAYIEFAQILVLVRGGLAAILFSLLGLCWGGWLNLSIQSKHTKTEPFTVYQLPVWQPFCFLAGILFCSWFVGTAAIDIKTISLMTSLVLLCLAVVIWFSHLKIPQTRFQLSVGTCSLAALTLSLLYHQNYDVQRSAKLLFSTNTFTGLRYGMKSELLPHLDEGRCLSEVDGKHGTFTLWSYRENQIQIRRSGLPFGVTSIDPGLCPHTTGELMPFLVPVILHERPSNVLFLGLGSGVGLNSSLDFPVQHVTCMESDQGLVKLYQNQIAPRNAISAFESDRVELVQLPVSLAMAAKSETDQLYDLIISNPVQSVVTQSLSEYTAEFYQNVSRHLNEGGIFCQRFQHIDFGAQPLRVIAQTFISQFKQVIAIEIANGETLFLATNSDLGFIRENLLDRIQAPQVRSTLAQVGWDWSVLLNLAAYSGNSLQSMTTDVKTNVNNAANGMFAFTLPYEMMRWGFKREEIKKMISQKNRTGRLIDWMYLEKDDPIILRRLSEITAQNKLMAQYPDQFWKYRKPAKDQITENPRSLIKQVAAESIGKDSYIHDEDKSRMLYFKALSNAMEKSQPSVESIRRVVQIATVYDPMISYFMHDEVAELYKKSKDAPPILEFAHRLHAINYGAASDRSINSVVRAMKLANANPNMFQTTEQQWDHLNGLLQELKRRWDNRSQARPVTSKQALHDIELSLSVIEQTFDTMRELHDPVGISNEDWRLRKLVLERTLVRPLQTYHSRVLPHHYKKTKEETKELLDSLNLPEIPAL